MLKPCRNFYLTYIDSRRERSFNISREISLITLGQRTNYPFAFKMNVMKRFSISYNQTARVFYRHGINRLLSEQGGKFNFESLVKDKPVVVFMKGTPDAPRCGFSNAVCQILRFHGVNDFKFYDVLADDAIRTGVKEYTEWPTIPQVFFNGEFIGGCDIMLDMHKNGDLIEELKKIGVRSALLDAKPGKDGDKS